MDSITRMMTQMIPDMFQFTPTGWVAWVGVSGVVALLVWFVISIHQWNALVSGYDAKSSFIFPLRRHAAHLLISGLIFVLLAFVLMWRPVKEVDLARPESTGVNVFFLIDVSSSMNIEDVKPSRLEGVKRAIEVAVRRSTGDGAYGLMVFSSSFYFVCPLTTDKDTFLFLLDHIEPGILQGRGTRLSDALSSLLKLSDEVIEKSNLDESFKVPYFVVFSDGEDFSDQTFSLGSYEKYKGRFLFVGVGHEKPMPVPVFEHGKKTFLYDKQGALVMSMSNFESLKHLAQVTGGTFTRLEDTPLEDILSAYTDRQPGRIGSIGSIGSVGVVTTKAHRPAYGVFGLVVFVLLAIKIMGYSQRALWVWLILLGIGQSVLTPGMAAQGAVYFSEPSPGAYYRHEKAKKAYGDKNVDEAKEYLSQTARSGRSGRIDAYNLGVLSSEDGDIESAEPLFRQAGQEDATVFGELSSQEQRAHVYSTFNQGVLAYQKGDRDRALTYFKKSLDDSYKIENPAAWVGAFQENARWHIADLLGREQEQQEKQDRQNNQSDDQGGEESHEQDKKDQSQDQSGQSQDQNTSDDQQKQEGSESESAQEKNDKGSDEDKNKKEQQAAEPNRGSQDMSRAAELRKRLLKEQLKQQREATQMKPMILKPEGEPDQSSEEGEDGPVY